jgi:hypothetical protein
MRSILVLAVAVALLWPAVGWGQSVTGTLTATSGSASTEQGAPSTWVTAARARHQAYIQARVGNPRSGQPGGTLDGLETASGTSTGGLDFSSLLNLLTQYGLGGSADLSGLIDGLSGTTGSSTSGSGMTIEDLLRLRDQLQGTSGTSGTSGNTSTYSSKTDSRSQLVTTAASYETRTGSGAIGRLPKIEARSQTTTTTTDERRFVARWAEQMSKTVFAALTVGFSSQDFVTLLKDALRPIFTVPDDDSTDGDTDNSSGGGGNNTSDEDTGSLV